ncbi:MAG: DnaJ domain-containing protein [Alphaproteobacteria bacterium]|nr:DnaJ domain-containing protein [Alphaproteobacteria bacterium]
MLPPQKDRKNYYSILGLKTDATQGQIKTAYRKKAKQLHPDSNSYAGAEDKFMQLSEAYQVLRSPLQRNAYDIDKKPQKPLGKLPLQNCSWCKKVTAQPRFVIFREVVSHNFHSEAKEISGVFCSDCAQNAAIRASFKTWVLGWWGMPFGFILTIATLWRNLLGGRKPKTINSRLLLKQAKAFQSQGEFELAKATAEQARKYTKSPFYINQINSFKAPLKGKETKTLKNNWRFFNRSFAVQLAPILMIAIISGAFSYAFRDDEIKTKKSLEIVRQEEIKVIALPENGDSEFIYQTTSEFLHVRKGPSLHFGIISTLKKYSKVRLTGLVPKTSWVRIKTKNGSSGFVLFKHLVKSKYVKKD